MQVFLIDFGLAERWREADSEQVIDRVSLALSFFITLSEDFERSLGIQKEKATG